MNLTCQEILKNIKAEEAQDENDILKEISKGSRDAHPLNDIIGLERDLNEFLILEDEWNILRELCRVFKMFYDVTLYMSNSQFVTLSSSIPIYNSLLEHFEKLLDENNKKYYCKSSEVRLAITKGYEKLKTYYSKTDDSHTYAIATSIFSTFFFFVS
ncbi:unnamed protein product [Rhizophagus irregularis]|nr:unnamed protein product [Rhizophagus irregularis]